MSVSAMVLVALGGAVGSVLRALAARAIPAGALPWGTIAVNIAGSLLIGWLMGRFGALDAENARVHSFWVAGVCGGFTTFSAFSWQTFEQLNRGAWATAALHVLVSVVCCVAATWIGWRCSR
jgi:CrcB protein